jgi:tight adherence protein C
MWTSEPLALRLLRGLVVLACALALFFACRPLWRIPASAAPAYGLRGKRRSRSRQQSALFRLLEPALGQLAGFLGELPLPELRAWLTRQLRHAGEPAGLSANELLALSSVSFVLLGSSSFWLLRQVDLSVALASASVLLVGTLPVQRVLGQAKERAKQLERSLPSAMDLCVLCMGAGADFPGALAFVVGELGDAHEVCRDELQQLLDELALGRTRVEALSALSSRSSSVAVREFVSAVCQSEDKGTPMIEALTIQSTTLRQRRSVRAEELAAQAGVKMMLPLMLLVASLLLIVFGPLIVTGVGL